MENSHYLEAWIFASTIAYLLFGHKPRNMDFGQFYAGLIMAWLLPLWVVVAITVILCRFKQLKWLKRYWICVALKQAMNLAMSVEKKSEKSDI